MWGESLHRLLVPLGKLWLIIPLERSEVRCVLHNRVDELHQFDDGHHSFLHAFIGLRYWWGEHLVKQIPVVAEPFEEEVDRFLRGQVIVHFDYQVLGFGYVAIDIWVSELQLVKLVPCLEFACGVYELLLESFLEIVPYCGYIVVYQVELSEGFEHVSYQ